MAEIWSIILAAGESKRMGSPKMLLKINGIPMIEQVIRNVKTSEVNNIIVVLGAYYDEIVHITDIQGVDRILNKNYRNGMLSSVKCGLKSVPADCDACLVFQGDQPFIGSDVINKVIDVFRKSGKGIVIPLFRGKKGHPLLLAGKYLSKVEELDDKEGLRGLARIFKNDVFEFETGEPGILKDIDTWKDYQDILTN